MPAGQARPRRVTGSRREARPRDRRPRRPRPGRGAPGGRGRRPARRAGARGALCTGRLLVEQPEECGPGEPYEPMDVNLLFGERTVALRGPWNSTDLVKIGPDREDLAGLYEYHLDFPGSPLQPGCGYERWARRLVERVRAHRLRTRRHRPRLPRQAGAAVLVLLRVQRLQQHARGRLGDDPARLRRGRRRRRARRTITRPRSDTARTRARSGRRGATTSSRSSTARIRSCSPRPGPTRTSSPRRSTSAARRTRASAATTRGGRTSSSGRRCGRSRAIRRPRRRVSVDHVRGPVGRAPEGVLQRPDRAEPEGSVDCADRVGGRGGATAATGSRRPACSGTGATDLFCSGVEQGSEALSRLIRNPAADPPVARRAARAGRVGDRAGDVDAGRAAAHRTPPHVGPDPVGVRADVRRTPAAVRRARPPADPDRVSSSRRCSGCSSGGIDAIGSVTGEAAGFFAFFAVVIGTTLTLLGLGLVQAATACALVEIDAGRPIGPIHAYRLALRRIRPLLGAIGIFVAAWVVLTTSVVLIPVAIWLVVRWCLLAPVVELEDRRRARRAPPQHRARPRTLDACRLARRPRRA